MRSNGEFWNVNIKCLPEIITFSSREEENVERDLNWTCVKMDANLPLMPLPRRELSENFMISKGNSCNMTRAT